MTSRVVCNYYFGNRCFRGRRRSRSRERDGGASLVVLPGLWWLWLLSLFQRIALKSKHKKDGWSSVDAYPSYS